MSPEYTKRVTQVTVLPADAALYSEMSTMIQIVDEAGGEFVSVEQHGRKDIGKVCMTPEEWPSIRAAIDEMMAACRVAS